MKSKNIKPEKLLQRYQGVDQSHKYEIDHHACKSYYAHKPYLITFSINKDIGP